MGTMVAIKIALLSVLCACAHAGHGLKANQSEVDNGPEHPPLPPTTVAPKAGDAPAHPLVSPTSETTVCTQLRLPPRHVFTRTNEDGGALVVNRWFDNVLVKARLE